MADARGSIRMRPPPISGGSTPEAELAAAPRVAWPARAESLESPLAQGVRRFRRSTTALVGVAIVLVLVLGFADGVGPRDGPAREACLRHGPPELLGCLLDRLVPAASPHNQPGTVAGRPDAGGDAGAGGDRVSQLDHLLARQHPVAFGLDANAPSHWVLLIRGRGLGRGSGPRASSGSAAGSPVLPL